MTGVLGAVTSGARTFWAALTRYLDADGMRQGAAVSFYAAFSMAPLLVVVAAVMVWLLGDDGAQVALLDALTRLIGERETKTLSELLARHASTPTEGAQAIFGSWLALGTTLIGATGVFVDLRSAVRAMLGDRDGALTWRRLVQVRLLVWVNWLVEPDHLAGNSAGGRTGAAESGGDASLTRPRPDHRRMSN